VQYTQRLSDQLKLAHDTVIVLHTLTPPLVGAPHLQLHRVTSTWGYRPTRKPCCRKETARCRI